MSDPVFNNLMVHTCTITQAGISTQTAAAYGHKKRDYTTTPAATYTGVRCRLRSLTMDEEVQIGRDEVSVQDFYLYVASSQLPTSVKDDGANATHQVSDVRTLAGTLVKAGPFDIQSIREIAGVSHHYVLQLRKAGV